jgi:serine/threonine-protein kinase
MDTWDGETRARRSAPRGVELPGAPARAMTTNQRYAVESLLGEGGMGIVHLCHDLQIGRRVAKKSMQSDRVDHVVSQQRFVREARVQGQLEHPAVVPVYDLGLDADGGIFFTMKRVRGLTLEEILDGLTQEDEEIRAYWTQRRLLNAFSRVCLAVDFCHQQGVLHRDIKPSNMMFGEFGEVYLLDWGLAKIWAESQAQQAAISAGADPSHKGAILGTPGYMSPEQVRGEEKLQPQSDVYGLGSVLFEILTLQHLHIGDDIEQVMEATNLPVDARPSRRAPELDVAPELEEICVKAVALRPADRYASARVMSEQIEAFMEGQRDVELRQDMAQQHAEAAREALRNSNTEPERITEFRQAAMRELGRALALDPNNEAVRETLVSILTGAQSRVPPEIERDLANMESQRTRTIGLAACFAYLSLLVYGPLFAWAGVENALLLGLFYLGVLVAAFMSLSAWLSQRPSPHIPFVVMLVSTAAFGVSASFFGPLLLAPSIVANNVAAFSFHFVDWRRWASIGAGMLALAIPLGLELTGVVEPSYSFSEQGMLITSKAFSLSSPGATMIFLCIASVAIVLTLSVMLGSLRSRLRAAERNIYVYTWHLRQLLPSGRTRM